MKKVLLITSFIIAAIASSSSYAQGKYYAVDTHYMWGTVPEDLRAQYWNIISALIGVVKYAPPKDDNLFSWSDKNNEFIKNKKLYFYITTSDDPVFSKYGVDNYISTTTDTMTFMVANSSGFDIYLCLLVDRLFFDYDVYGNSSEKKDATTRTTVALAHEIYGNVQSYLEMKIDPVNYNKEEEQKKYPTEKLELKAFQAGINFIKRLQLTDKYKQFSDKIKTDYNSALKREQTSLGWWKNKAGN